MIKSSNETSNTSNTTLTLVLIGNLIAHSAEHIFAMSLAPLFVLMIQDIPITLTQIGLLSTSQVVPNVALGLVYGILADKYGSKFFIIGGTGLSSLGVYLTARATTYFSLLLAQVLLGIGLSAYHPTGLCMVTRVFSKRPKVMGRGLSIQGIGGAGGSGVAPLLMVTLAQWSGDWRSALKIIAIGGFGATLLEALTLLPIHERTEPVRDEPLSNVVATHPKGHQKNISFLTASFIILLVFSFTRSAVFRNAMYFLPIYFESLGYTVFLAGVFTSIFFGIGAVSQVFGGILVDKTVSKQVIFIGSSVFSGIACLVLAFIGRGGWTISILVIFGVSFFIAIPSISVSVSQHAPVRSQGIAFATFFAVISLFGALSSTVFGLIGDRWSLQMGLVFIGLLCFIGSLIGSKIQENPLKQTT
ncbi:MAG: MFS transporter [Candidatus Heimdallarchaeota archaeon]